MVLERTRQKKNTGNEDERLCRGSIIQAMSSTPLWKFLTTAVGSNGRTRDSKYTGAGLCIICRGGRDRNPHFAGAKTANTREWPAERPETNHRAEGRIDADISGRSVSGARHCGADRGLDRRSSNPGRCRDHSLDGGDSLRLSTAEPEVASCHPFECLVVWVSASAFHLWSAKICNAPIQAAPSLTTAPQVCDPVVDAESRSSLQPAADHI